MRRFVLGAALLAAVLSLACNGDSTATPAATKTAAPTSTPTVVATASPTAAPTSTPTPPPVTATGTPDPGETATPVPTATATEAPTDTPTAEPTDTPTPRPTGTIPGPIDTPEPDPAADAYAHALTAAASESLGREWSIEGTDDFSDSLTEGFEYDTDACNDVTNTLGQADDVTMLTGIGKAAVDYEAPLDPDVDPALDAGNPNVEIEINVLNDEAAARDAAGLVGEVLGSDLLIQCFMDVFAVETPDAVVEVTRIEPTAEATEGGFAGAYSISLSEGETELTFASEIYIWSFGSLWLSLEVSGDVPSPATVNAAIAVLESALAETPAP